MGDESLAVEVGGELLDRVAVGGALDCDVAFDGVEAWVHVLGVVLLEDFFVENSRVGLLLLVEGLLEAQSEGEEELRDEEREVVAEGTGRGVAGVGGGSVREGHVVDDQVHGGEEREELEGECGRRPDVDFPDVGLRVWVRLRGAGEGIVDGAEEREGGE